MQRVTQDNNLTNGDYSTYSYKNDNGTLFDVRVSGSSMATLLNNNDNVKVETFLNSELPKYLYQVSQLDPTLLGANSYPLTTYDSFFNKDLSVFKSNLENYIKSSDIEVVGSLKEYSDLILSLERVIEKYTCLSKEDFNVRLSFIRVVKFTDRAFYTEFLIQIANLLDSLSFKLEVKKYLKGNDEKNIRKEIISLIKSKSSYTADIENNYSVLGRDPQPEVLRLLQYKKLQNEFETIKSIRVIRNYYSHKKIEQKQLEKAVKTLDLNISNPATSSEFKKNIIKILIQINGVMQSLLN